MSDTIDLSQLELLKKSLPKSYKKTLAEKCNVSQVYVDKVFKGDGKKFELVKKIINEAIKLKNQHQLEISKLNDKLNNA